MRRANVLPGFRLSLGYTLVYLSLLVLIPLGGLVLKGASLSAAQFLDIAGSERALASYRVTFGASLAAAAINALFGLVVAWVLVRYEFPFRRQIDALVDLPFALPTPWPASPSPRCTRATAGSAGSSNRPASRSPSRRWASWWRSPSSACPSSCAPCSP